MVPGAIEPERRRGSDRRGLSGAPAASLAPPPAGLRRAVELATWCALTVGLIEVAFVAVQQHLFEIIVFRSPHYLWMAPVGSMTLFIPIVGMLWLLAWRWPVLISVRVVTAVLVFLSVLTVLVLPGWLHAIAALALAAGLTPHLSRQVSGHWDAASRVVRRTMPAYAVMVPMLAAWAIGAPLVRERLALRALPPAAPGAPNVLLIILDTVRGGSSSLLGYRRETMPNLEWLASRGVTFQRAVAPAPWTLPTHASVLTGYPPHELSVGFFSPLDDQQATLAEVLADNGYATAGFVANFFNADYEHGISRGFLHWEDYRLSPGVILNNAVLTRRFIFDGAHGRQNSRLLQLLDLDMRIGEKTADEVNANALEWLTRPRGRPSFVLLNYFDAHYPYDPPEPYSRQFGAADTLTRPFVARLRRALSLTRWRGESQGSEAELRDLYEEEIVALDALVGRLLRDLDARGVLDSTLVIVTSDHGEEFGEHGQYEHGNNLFLTQLHVPLVISYPKRIPSGVSVPVPVGLRHLAATVLDVTRSANTDSMPGRSLAALWNTPASADTENVLSTLRKRETFHASLTTPRLRYIYADGREQLFDHVRDPLERSDLSKAAWADDTLDLLRREMADRLDAQTPAALRAVIDE